MLVFLVVLIFVIVRQDIHTLLKVFPTLETSLRQPFAQLKTRFGNSNFIGIRLISGSSELSSFLNRHVEYPKSIECKIWKKEKSFSIRTDTYDRCIAISTTTLRNDSTFLCGIQMRLHRSKVLSRNLSIVRN